MKALVGLGNPGIKYLETRHNAGFEVIDQLGLSVLDNPSFKKNDRLFSQIALVNFNESQLLLVKPITYMNETGKAFIAIKNWYKLDLEDFLIIHDDVSLPLGKIRLQKDGGAGGQHGIESIIDSIGGNKNFNRLKVGIGPDPGGDVRANYVLQKFTQVEKLLITEVINIAAKASIKWLNEGIGPAMNEFNGIDISTPINNGDKIQ